MLSVTSFLQEVSAFFHGMQNVMVPARAVFAPKVQMFLKSND